MSTALHINGRTASVDVDPSTPLLWALRDELQLTGTKFGCGAAQCGACTVHVNGVATRSCVTPVAAVGSGKVLTIEAMANDRVGKAVEAAGGVDTLLLDKTGTITIARTGIPAATLANGCPAFSSQRLTPNPKAAKIRAWRSASQRITSPPPALSAARG